MTVERRKKIGLGRLLTVLIGCVAAVAITFILGHFGIPFKAWWAYATVASIVMTGLGADVAAIIRERFGNKEASKS